MEHLFYLFIDIPVATAGFILASYMWHKKRKQKEFTCPLKGKCHDVVQTKYSKIFGFPIEVLGMMYYAFIGIGWAFVLFTTFPNSLLENILALATTGAFLFSIYLTLVQVFILRKLCAWCIVSAIFCTILFSSIAIPLYNLITQLWISA
jgi:uncharacterized membrane protein